MGPSVGKTFFCLDDESRKKVFYVTGKNVKYLRGKDEGLVPILFLGREGIPSEINSKIRERLTQEKLYVGEGWKTGLAFCYVNLNFLALGSCNALLEFLNEYSIPKNLIKGIFADGDVLSNLKVTQAYRLISENFKDCPIYVHPPEKIISLEGGLNFDKKSPDDWITEDFTVEQVFQNVQEINITLLESQLLTIVQKSTFSTTLKYKFSTQEKQKNLMVSQIREFFKSNAFFVPTTETFYLFDQNTFLWSVFTHMEATYFCLDKFRQYNVTFRVMGETVKTVAAACMKTQDAIQDIFYNTEYIGFQNGVFNLKTKVLESFKKEHYLMTRSKFDYVQLSTQSYKITQIAPTICKWISDRVFGSEIQTNVLIAILLSCILKIEYPERFLFITGHSATGKSTYFMLLVSLLSSDTVYTVSANDFTCDFGFEDLADGLRKSVIIFHDIGERVTANFVDILRTLISSTGETNLKRVRRKNKKTARLQFSGFICAASNKSPLTKVQSEGIQDRRLILIPFTRRIEPGNTQTYEELFPKHECQNLVSFAVNQNKKDIHKFCLMATQHPELRQIILNHYAENIGSDSDTIEKFIYSSVTYKPGSWCPYGFRDSSEGTLLNAFYIFIDQQSEDDPSFEKKIGYLENPESLLKYKLLPLIQLLFPEWKGIEERRRIFNGSKMIGLTNISIKMYGRPELNGLRNEKISGYFKECKKYPWWIIPEADVQETSADVQYKLESISFL